MTTFTVTIWRDPPHDAAELDVDVALGEDDPRLNADLGITAWDFTLLNADHLSAAERDAALAAARRWVDGWGRG